jgi:S1-C subfamily serine protease
VLQALSNELADAAERAGRSVVAIHARRRIPASGVVWRPGVVVAASHTIQREENITVTLHDGTTVPATLAGRDPGTDLAVLRLGEGAAAPAATVGDSAALRVGHLVLALGRPGSAVTASLGAVSALGGEWRTWHGGVIDRFVRLDLAIYDGFSGGPLVDARGQVLGINTSGLARALAMTVPAATVERVVGQLLERGRVSRGYLGLGMQPVRLPASLVAQHKLPHESGLMVVTVDPGGPADRAGVLLGDVLLSVDGTPVDDARDVLALLGPDRVGKPLRVRLIRAGAPTEAEITVGERG